MKTSVAIAAVSALMATPLLAQTAQPQSPVFRASADVVTVDAAVQRDRRPVTGLKPADFELLDNGVPQEISEVAYERLPIDVTLVLDVSASVSGPVLEELGRALRQVRADLLPSDRLRLLIFNMSVRRLVDFSQPATSIDEALASVRGAGSSAVFDSLAVALSTFDAPGRRRLVVLFTDGQDSSSISDAETLLEVARRTTPTVAVILGTPNAERPASLLRTSSTVSTLSVGALSDRIALETGGMVAPLKPGENLTSKFRRMLQEFRSSYVLYFTPRGVERSGAHTLEVRVKRPGVDIRARRGYVWK
jgi:Ca-activated chloride channel family protein